MDIGTLRLIIDVALAIEKAAENVEQNKKDCEEMRSNVALVRTNLMRLENNEPLMMDPAVSPTVAAIGEILREAQELVEDCKVKRNVVELLFTAGKLSKKLKETRNRILFNTIILMCAITVRQECRRPTQEQVHVPPPPAPKGDMNNQQQSTSIVNKIVDVADRIKATAKMVRRNKDECHEIDERAGIVSAFLPQLENTGMIKDPALSAELEKIVRTLQHAYELVTACQGRSLFTIRPARGCQGGHGGGELSKELHQVLDQMVLDLDGITEISIRYTEVSREVTSAAVRITATLMVGHFVVKLRLARQRSKTITIQSIGETSQLHSSFQADPEEIEAVAASESVTVAGSSNRLHDDPSLLQGDSTSEAQGASSKD
ncbi:hypothetical protein PAHAL_3G426000 [Panicum hallii]|uniref:Uncharacterized protein n=1 Tax=Panicum hallii TaxID=206008 RepID=A0A2T8KL31_9POAL|nr:uncharacterized protein LOC112887625 [Panicum hallii]PVH62897.1 hypothetical protein PAHAL_3G426000 [Panicum hallii]